MCNPWEKGIDRGFRGWFAMDKPTTVSDNPRVFFASTHCLLDFASGAAVATALTLETLAGQGFQCHAYCASHFDAPQETPLEQVLAGAGRTSAVRGGPGGGQIVETALGARGWVPVSIFKTASSRGWHSAVEPRTFLDVYSALLDMVRPQLLLTYGGDPAGREMVRLAKARGCTVVFLLHNLAYGKRETFAGVDHVVVPTEFARRHYQERLGLVSHVLPCIVDPERVENRKISNLKSEISNKSETQEQRNSKRSPLPNPLPEGEGTMPPSPGGRGDQVRDVRESRAGQGAHRICANCGDACSAASGHSAPGGRRKKRRALAAVACRLRPFRFGSSQSLGYARLK